MGLHSLGTAWRWREHPSFEPWGLRRWGSWEMELEWDIVWGWEWRISSVDSKRYNDSDCVYDILMCWFWCGIFDVGVETFWCCLKTLLLLPSNGCNTRPHFHPQSWTPSIPLSLTLSLNSFPILILFLYLTFTQSWVLTNPSLGPHASLESSFFPVPSCIPDLCPICELKAYF